MNLTKLDLLKFAQELVVNLHKVGLSLDYSLASLNQIESYLSKNLKGPGQAKAKSFFAEDPEFKLLYLGAYLGEVIRRNGHGLKWSIENAEAPDEITLVNPEGGTALVINKAYKRFFHGEADNIAVFAKALLDQYLKFEGDIPADFFDQEDLRIQKYAGSPVVIYSKAIATNQGLVSQIHYKNGQWYFFTDQDNYDASEEEPFDLLFLDEVKEKHPEFSDMLEAKDQLRIMRREDGSYHAQNVHKGLFLDNQTAATFQGDMQLNLWQWIKFNRATVVRKTFYLTLWLILMLKVHWLFVIPLLVSLLLNLYYWSGVYSSFKSGDVNPGKVISLNPVLVAVATDMRKFGGEYPVLKIIETKLPKEDMVLRKIIPTVALYNNNPHGYPFWAVFSPVPVVQGIRNRAHIDSIVAQFSQESIDALNHNLRQVTQREVGIYKVDEDTTSWRDFKHVDLSKGINMEGPVK